MVKIAESVIKTVIHNKRKWLSRLTKMVMEVGSSRSLCVLVTHTLPGPEQAPDMVVSCQEEKAAPTNFF
jgi:hypothetical protein